VVEGDMAKKAPRKKTARKKTSIAIKRAYEAPQRGDGMRILVDRMWPRGVSKEEAEIDLWLKEIAPSTALRKWFGHEADKWPKFREKYFQELAANGDVVAELKACLKKGKVTLIYAAKDEEHNNAVALAEYLEAR
jgi:uncharacterized protein YeaO (DUF488 family)